MEKDKITELQDIWQSHDPGKNIDADSGKFMSSILNKIKQTERLVFRKNMAKTIAIIFLSVSFIWLFYTLGVGSVVSWLGIGTILGSTAIMMILYWRIQFKSSNLNHNLPQKEFIKDAISQMRRQKILFVRLFRWFVFFMIVGINLLYIDLLADLEIMQRLIFHFAITLFLIVIFLMGLKIRERKFNKEFQPLIDELESIKE